MKSKKCDDCDEMWMDLRLWGSYSRLHQCDWRRIWVKWAWLMSSKPLTAFSSGEMNRNESDHVTRESERRCFGLLQHAIALKRQWIWLALRSKHTVPALFAHAQFSPHFLCLIVWKLQDTEVIYSLFEECWSVWERARHAGISAVCGQHVHTCEVPLDRWVSRGAVEVRGHLYSCGSANRRPAGFSPALSVSNATQEDCWMFVHRLALVWWFLAFLIVFFWGLNYSWCPL